MSVARAEMSALIRAPARNVYQLIADYRNGHPQILPTRYFPRLEVERGGVGAGTVIRFQLRAFGTTREIRAEITEPLVGQILVETDLATGGRTTYTITPEGDGQTCNVRIETQWDAKGVRGWIERLAVPRLLRQIYAEELAILATRVEGERVGRASGPA